MKKTAAALLAAGLALSAGITATATDPSAAEPTPTVANTAQAFSHMTSATILSSCIDSLEQGSYGGENEHYSYAYYYGTPASLQRYSQFINDTSYNNASDRLTGNKTLVNRWLSQSINGESTIIKITAKTDLTLHLTSESDASHSYTCWSPDAYFEYIAEGTASDGNTYRISLDRRFALVDAAENSYAFEVTMKAGDSFLFLFGSDFKTAKSASRWIGFSVTLDYDAAKRPDFEAMPAVTQLKQERLTALRSLAEAVSIEAGYNSDSITAARAALADASRRFDRAGTVREVEEVYQSIVRSILAAKRLTVTEDALSLAVAETCERLDALMNSIDRVKYAAVYEAAEEYYYEGLAKVYEATNPTSARYQYSVYQNKIMTLLYACEKGGNA